MRWISDLPDPFAGSGDPLPFGRRLKKPRGHRIPVTIVTGFLGAGKSTLVRRLLETDEARDTAVIVNEIGQIGIDDALLSTSGETVRLLANGCLCCAVRSDLEVTLRELHADRGAGKVAAFRRVILETSGAADPAAILQTLVGNRALAGTFHLAGIVTVVDSMHGSVTLAESPEARMQVALADRFVVTKVDLTSMEQVEAVEAELAAVNPCASLLRAIDGNADPGFVLAEATPRSAFAAAIAPLHMPGMTSFSLAFERSFTPGALREAMSTLTQLRGRDLLRVKGLVNVAGCRGPVVVHAVRHQVHPPSELERWPDEDRRSRFVFVVRDTPADAVRRLFDSIAELASVPDRSSP